MFTCRRSIVLLMVAALVASTNSVATAQNKDDDLSETFTDPVDENRNGSDSNKRLINKIAFDVVESDNDVDDNDDEEAIRRKSLLNKINFDVPLDGSGNSDGDDSEAANEASFERNDYGIDDTKDSNEMAEGITNDV